MAYIYRSVNERQTTRSYSRRKLLVGPLKSVLTTAAKINQIITSQPLEVVARLFWPQSATGANIKYAELKHHQQLKIEGIVYPNH